MSDIKEISADQYAETCSKKTRFPHLLELEFYGALDRRYLGVVTRDRADMDFGFAVLAHLPKHGEQVILRLHGGIDTLDEARTQLLAEMGSLVPAAGDDRSDAVQLPWAVGE